MDGQQALRGVSRARALGDVRVKVKDTDQQCKMQDKIVTKNIVCCEVLRLSQLRLVGG